MQEVAELRAAVELAERGLDKWREQCIEARAEIVRLLAPAACAKGVLTEPLGREFQIKGTIQEVQPYCVRWQQLIGCRSMGDGYVTRDTLEAAILAILDQVRGTFADLVERGKVKS